MSRSQLVDYVKISPNSTNPRNHKIDTITIHHMAGNLSVETCGEVFAASSRQASSNYGVGTDGRIGLYVEEENRSWCTSNRDNDNRAVTIEVANDSGDPDWHVSDKALASLINLCVDICKRNDIPKLNYTGTKSGNLTMHKWFASTACPGPYLGSKFPYIADEVNKRLSAADAPADEPAKEPVVTPVVSDHSYGVQVGAHASMSAAVKFRDKAIKAGFNEAFIVNVDDKLFRTYVGVRGDKAEANELRSAAVKAGYRDAFVTKLIGVTHGAAVNVGDRVEVNFEGTVKSVSGDYAVVSYDGGNATIKLSKLTVI